jgi:methionine-rich copper-binding protein CopC
MKQLITIVSTILLLTGIVTAQDMTVTSTNPSDDDVMIALDANIEITFSEAINGASANSNSITVVGSGNYSQFANYSTSGNTVTINPLSNFGYSETITVTVTTQVQSSATYGIGIPADLLVDSVFTFKTIPGPYRPTV